MEIKDLLLKTIKDILDNIPKPRFDWNDSLYEDIRMYLPIDSRGKLGEMLSASILREFGCRVEGDDSSTDAERGYDIISNGIKLEVKLATITVGSGGFQHENLHSQRDFDAVLFIDVAPNEVFLTAVRKRDIVWSLRSGDRDRGLSALHRRPNGDYKCDFSIFHIRNNNIPKFREYKTGEVKTTKDFYNIYKFLED